MMSSSSSASTHNTPTKKKAEHEFMTATKRLLAGLRDGKMADVELVGDDGIRVPALRCVLACASPVMHNLLYGDPSRATSSLVRISGCSNKTLRALVEYCCSDELNASIWDGSCPPAEIVKDIVALARVSHAYGIPNMEERVLEGINPLMGAIPPLACVVFNYADPGTTRAIHGSALAMIREKPYVCLQQEGQNVGGMVCLSPEKLKEIIQDAALQVDELFLFKQLLRWRAYNRNVYANVNDVCKKLVSYIDLTYIDPTDIKNIVLESGMVEDKAIIDALLEQAIAATREGLAYAAMRGGGISGKDQLYAMVQGAGTKEVNGLYRQVRREGAMLCYARINTNNREEKRTVLLLKDGRTSWKICDDKNLLYEWKSNKESHYDQFPVSGWAAVSQRHVSGSSMATPTIKWFRPRGKSPRLPVSAAPLPSSFSSPSPRVLPSLPSSPPPTTRIPISLAPPPYDAPARHTSSPDEDGFPSFSSHHPHTHQQLRHHRSMDEADSPTPMSSRLRESSSHSHANHHRSQFHSNSSGDSPSSGSDSNHGNNHPAHHSLHRSASMEQQYGPKSHQYQQHHSHHRLAARGRSASPHTPVAVRISPRTPSPRLGFHTMPSVQESASWAM